MHNYTREDIIRIVEEEDVALSVCSLQIFLER